ncbi:MAG: methylated-DNA--[protein]-cysteine S-methyltransferase [Spirochaetales bacterium]|uniref:Methylated-DNA--protein-cysteine methyltransferase n=1 Tax=Candidatus Thalassospirochaeta sargassi TaxID=3119039 RepID=A0AAJ1IEK0_9SPIO|nr:methylated-DNA--[protein]-cysteine S-methyltransferase [Spirochaetales bacterium]
MYYTRLDTPVCEIILAGDEDGLQHLHLNTGEGKRRFEVLPDWLRSDDFFVDTAAQIREFCTGERRVFDIKLNPQGTDFQSRVWSELQRIPYGETRSYGEIASALGKPSAARAVGTANGRNPIPLIIPCHRVIGADGSLAGFAHGIAVKQRLLMIEKMQR